MLGRTVKVARNKGLNFWFAASTVFVIFISAGPGPVAFESASFQARTSPSLTYDPPAGGSTTPGSRYAGRATSRSRTDADMLGNSGKWEVLKVGAGGYLTGM